MEGPGEQLYVIAASGAPGEAPKVRWQRPGRGMRDGSRVLGFVAADLQGDGVCEVIAADRGRQGHAQLVAYCGDGSELWRKDFADTPGDLPVWNVGALTFWWPGRFRQPDAIDVFVNTRRGLMHSDVGHLLDGREATTAWTRDKAILPGEFHWGWAGTPLATVDLNEDGRDELTSLHPVCFWIADGKDGTITAGKDLASRKALPAWAAYGEPLVHDFNQDGSPEILLDSPYILALLDRSGKPLWHGLGRSDFPVQSGDGNVGETTSCKHALVDLDGDGVFEIASAGYGDGVRAIDPCSGTRLWSLAAPAPTCPRVAAANIDGQGGDEILYVAGNLLVAITGDRGSGRVLWTWQGPADLEHARHRRRRCRRVGGDHPAGLQCGRPLPGRRDPAQGDPGGYFANTLRIARQKSGRSSGLRLETKCRSMTTGESSQMAPAFTRSSLIPSEPVT